VAQGEGGNAVALTLLGLAVAILAGVVVLYFIGRSKPEPIYTPSIADEEVLEQSTTQTTNPREGWRSYEDGTYGFSIEFPQGWVIATGTLSTGEPVFSVYQAVGTGTDMVYSPLEDVSHVSVYPYGAATKGIHDLTKASKVIIEIPQAFAKDYVLESGRPWATEAFFEVHPEGWGENGFVFARTVIEEEEVIYYHDDKEVSESLFDPQSGDRLEHTGFIDQNVRSVEEEILRSFRFLDADGVVVEDLLEETNTLEMIESPARDEIVQSPLLVKGKVYAVQYQGNDVQLSLETEDGEVLTEMSVVSFDDWDTQEYIPFEVSLVFDATTATSGKLILKNTYTGTGDNEVIVPILFENQVF